MRLVAKSVLVVADINPAIAVDARYTIGDGKPAKFRIVDPDGKEVDSAILAEAKARDFQVKPAAEQTGRLWRVGVSGGFGYRSIALQGVPRYVALSADRHFIPVAVYEHHAQAPR